MLELEFLIRADSIKHLSVGYLIILIGDKNLSEIIIYDIQDSFII